VQTFLPDPSFVRTAALLDQKRLGKQRLEAWQILRTLTGETSGWRHHPAVHMWAGYEGALYYYGTVMCAEWTFRSFTDTIHQDLHWLAEKHGIELGLGEGAEPWWLGHPLFHASHRAALLAKAPVHYNMQGWREAPAISYWWPTKHLLEREWKNVLQ